MEYVSRRVVHSDYPLISYLIEKRLSRIKARTEKDWIRLVDAKSVLHFIFHHEHSYIVDGAYLVVFDIVNPWYNPDISILSEMLVGKIGGSHRFAVVPDFLERKAREAGCAEVSAGTALALSDRALASLYSRAGFKPACTQLSKRI